MGVPFSVGNNKLCSYRQNKILKHSNATEVQEDILLQQTEFILIAVGD